MRSVPTTFSHDSGSISNSSSATKRNAIWSAICTSVAARSCAIATAASTRPRGRRRRRSGRAPSAAPRPTRSSRSSRRIHSPLSQSSLSRSNAAAAWRHPIEVELRDELGGIHDFVAVVGRCPAEQREVVGERFGEVSGVDEVLERHRAVALRQLGPRLGVDDEGQVRVPEVVGDTRPADQCVAQGQDPVGGVDEVLTPDHVGDRPCRGHRPRWRGRRWARRRNAR